jgi:hypothetical protein
MLVAMWLVAILLAIHGWRVLLLGVIRVVSLLYRRWGLSVCVWWSRSLAIGSRTSTPQYLLLTSRVFLVGLDSGSSSLNQSILDRTRDIPCEYRACV